MLPVQDLLHLVNPVLPRKIEFLQLIVPVSMDSMKPVLPAQLAPTLVLPVLEQLPLVSPVLLLQIEFLPLIVLVLMDSMKQALNVVSVHIHALRVLEVQHKIVILVIPHVILFQTFVSVKVDYMMTVVIQLAQFVLFLANIVKDQPLIVLSVTKENI